MSNNRVGFTLLGILACALAGINRPLSCSEFPKAELAAYTASFMNLSNKDLVTKYRQEYTNLVNSFKDKTAKIDNMALSQLPVFKIAILKALVAEIRKREQKAKMALLPAQELQSGDNFIRQEETKMKTGLEGQKSPLSQ
jgi:hypothetical protein